MLPLAPPELSALVESGAVDVEEVCVESLLVVLVANEPPLDVLLAADSLSASVPGGPLMLVEVLLVPVTVWSETAAVVAAAVSTVVAVEVELSGLEMLVLPSSVCVT